MKRFGYILFVALALLTGCHGIDPFPTPDLEKDTERVTLSFKVAIPSDAGATRVMGNDPTIDTTGFYIAVFGGSGYFNEWVRATVTETTPAHYDGTNATVYALEAKLSISDSRLRLHFIANCPTAVRTSPPISGSQDTEEYVMSRIRSQRSEEYNDAYWQKVILPNGVRVNKVGNDYVATEATMRQFPDPIILVRNFARVYLRNLTQLFEYQNEPEKNHQLVTISKFGLAYAPSEGVVAPILSAPFSTDAAGNPIIEPGDEDTTSPLYFENFLMNYQRYPLVRVNQSDTLVTGAPFYYGGYSPSNQAYNYYPGNADVGIPEDADLRDWDSSNPENNVLFVYERTMPSAARRATRLIIKAIRHDYDGDPEPEKYYALDIVNTEGVAIPLLRNQSYTVHLLNIEAGTGESDINKASKATSASVTGDPNFQSLISISDGKSSIGTSFTEKFYVQPQLDSVMFRYIPTNVQDTVYNANQEANERVIVKVGSLDESSGVFTELTAAQAASQGILAFKTVADTCHVWIEKDGSGNAISYIRQQNNWVPATQAQVADTTIEKWGKIMYELNESYIDGDRFFTEARTQTIHVEGTYNGNTLSRNVIIRTSPRQSMEVTCCQKYVAQSAGEQEVVRILIPRGLSRSVFPLEFTIEPDGYSLTPDGDVLPVTYGSSTVPGVETPAFYFIKTITQSEYDGLGTVTKNGTVWKYVDCYFKTTVSNNACTVYVHNKYFSDAMAHDDFYNYTQRLFTFPTQQWSPTTVSRHGNVTLTFRMDYDHRSNSIYWWDPTNDKGLSADAATARENGLDPNNRVIPQVMTVILNGFTPQYHADGETPVTSGLQLSSGNTYLYYIPDANLTHGFANAVELALTATGVVGTAASVTLSTANITENPLLYAQAQSNIITIQGAQFSNVGFSETYINTGLNRTLSFHFTYADGVVEPARLRFEGLTPDGNTGDNALLSPNSDGVTYTLTPTDLTQRTYTISLKTTYRFSPCTVYLSADDYDAADVTINRSPSSISVATTSANYSNSNRSYTTEDGVTVAFSNTTPTFGGTYTTAPDNTDITVTAPADCHVTKIEINYSGANYYAQSVTVRSGGGSYIRSGTVGTWTAGNNSTASVTLRTTKRQNNNTRIASIVVYVEDN